MVGAIVGKHAGLVLDHRLQVDRPGPDDLQVGHGVRRLVHLQIDAVVLVPQQQLSPVFVIAVYHKDPRFAEIRQAEKQALLDFGKLTRLNDVLLRVIIKGEGEHLVLHAEFGRQKRLDKANIVMNAADLEDFFPAQP